MDSTVHKLKFSKSENDQSRFLAMPASGQDCSHLLSIKTWNALTRWSATLKNFTFPVTLLCHLQTGGPVCYITPDTASSNEEQARFLHYHKDCCNNNTVMILTKTVPSLRKNGSSSSSSDIELGYCLAPLWGTRSQPQGDGKAPIFAVYATGHHFALDFLLGKVIHPRRLPVVFDLDETLVKGRTLSHLSDESIRDTIERRRSATATDRSLSLEQKARQIDAEMQMLQHDAISLRSYRDTDTITLGNGTRVQAEYAVCPFYAEDSAGKNDAPSSVTRPVIQRQVDLVFTRIRPLDREQSMIFRIRPYWSEVRSLLTGGMDKINANDNNASTSSAEATVKGDTVSKPLIEAFVCTTADTEYAHEVWRVLDLNEALIPYTRWPKRIKTKAGKQKCLAPTLGLADHSLSVSMNNAGSIMPFAVILDDILEIWEPKVQNQVIHISKWEPYQEWGRVTATGSHWERTQAGLDMLKVGGVLRDLRKEIFDQIDNQLASKMPDGTVIHVATLDLTRVDASYAALFAPPPWTSRILPRVLESSKPLPLPAKALAAILAREERQVQRQKAFDEQVEKEKAAIAALPVPSDPRIAARAAAAASAATKQNQQPEQQKEEPAEFNPDTDMDVFANWGKMVTTDKAPQQQEEEEEASKNKRKREQEESSSLDNDIASDVLGEGDSGDAINLLSEEEEQQEQGPARKKAHLSKEDPIILLSQAAQSQGKHLTTETTAVGSGGYLVQIKSDGGKRIAYATGGNIEEARRNAAVNALNEFEGQKYSFGVDGVTRGGAALAPAVAAQPGATVAPAPAAQVHPGYPFGSTEPEVIEFGNALSKLRELYPTTGDGQRVVYREVTEPGDLVKRFQCTVRRDFMSGEPELTAVGVGENYYYAKRDAARIILTSQLGFQVV